MKLFLCISLVFIRFLVVSAQQPTIKWGTESKEYINFIDLISINAGNQFVKLSTESFLKNKPTLTYFDNSLTPKNSVEYFKDEKNGTSNGLIHIQENSFILTPGYNKKDNRTTQYAQKFNLKTLLPEGQKISLGNFDGKISSEEPEFRFSKDSVTLLMFVRLSSTSKDNIRFYIAVFNKEMQETWHKTVDLARPYDKAGVLTHFITNSGEVGIVVNTYDGQIVEKYDPDDTRIPAYRSQLLIYTKNEAVREIGIDMKGKFIHTLDVTEDMQNNIVFFGLYKLTSSGRISGFFKATLDKESKNLMTEKMNGFPLALTGLVINDGQGSDKDNDPGFSVNFKLNNVLKRENGSVDYVLQYFQYRHAPTIGITGDAFRELGGQSYTFGDIIDIHIQPSGQISYVRVPKNNYNRDTPSYGNMIALVKENKLLFFYNDDPDNLGKDISEKPNRFFWGHKSVFTMAVIDEKDKLTRSVVFDNRKSSTAVCPHFCRRVSANQIVLISVKPTLYASTGLVNCGLLTIQ